MEMLQLLLGLVLVIVHLVVLVLHMVHVLGVLVLQLLVSGEELPLKLLVPMVPFLLNGLVGRVVLFDVVVALIV